MAAFGSPTKMPHPRQEYHDSIAFMGLVTLALVLLLAVWRVVGWVLG